MSKHDDAKALVGRFVTETPDSITFDFDAFAEALMEYADKGAKQAFREGYMLAREDAAGMIPAAPEYWGIAAMIQQMPVKERAE